MVKGDIGREDYCEDLYADLQINGRIEGESFKTNLIAKGDAFKEKFKAISPQYIIDEITSTLRNRLG
jgi:hypothetical protein